jgi:hypothetical protein
MEESRNMNEIIVNGLAVIGAASCVIWLVKAVKAVSRRATSEATAPPEPSGSATGQPDASDLAAISAAVHAVVGPHRIVGVEPANDDIAAIAAAVYAVMGPSYRIVRIESGSRGQTWAAEGRWMHQTSHRPH